MGTGYKQRNQSRHPLAMANGKINIHRQTLWDHLHPDNPDPYTTYDHCHWCGWEIPWRTHHPIASRYAINVDHLDTNKHNNNLQNLVVSCGWCNSNRHWLNKHPIYKIVFKVHRREPPHKRTSPTHLATQLTGITFTEIKNHKKV